MYLHVALFNPSLYFNYSVYLGPIIDVFLGISGHLGHFGYFLLIFSKMNLKTQKFDSNKIIYFWKAEVVPFSDLPKFFKSEVI